MSKVLFSPTPKQQEEFEKIASSIFRGLKYMADNDLMSAVECFKRAQKGAPGIPTGGNNLAMCLFLLGKHEEAVATQEKCNEMSSIPNTFGLANLALFLRLGNNLEEGNTKLDTALGLDMPSIDAILRLCQVLAIYKRHEDILALTEKYAPFIDDTIKFYRGCAVANLGRNSEAAVLFKGVSSGFKVGMACVYSQWLSIGNAPSTVNGDWYYFNVNEMMGLISLVLVGENVDSVLTVDLIESMINDITEGVGHREMLQLLGKCKHPEAKNLLEKIAFGEFGTDKVRESAYIALSTRPDVAEGELDGHPILIKGERVHLKLGKVKVDHSVKYGCELSDEVYKLYEKAVDANHEGSDTFAEQAERFREIIKLAPDYFPARFNLAVNLINSGLLDEAEEILDELVANHPEYLFAAGTLLEMYVLSARMEEADSLMAKTEIPALVHPEALGVWLIAQVRYYKEKNNTEEMLSCFRMAYMYFPSHPMWEFYEDEFIEMGLIDEDEFDD